MLRVLLVGLLVLATCAIARETPATDDIGVQVERRGSLLIIDVDLPLDVSPEEAWETVTDYDHMPRFLPKLLESRVLSRDGNRLRILQKGRTSRGPLSFSFENVRNVVLVPHTEIRTELVSGTLREARSVTRIVPRSPGSRLVNHGEYRPAAWVPLVIAMPLIEAETREQFGLLRAEIVRRKARRTPAH